ncbi:MAG TPA: zinc ABC transporter substrate-binding protein [Xanthobacteraceae bacterium]|jgi:zinc/manganese transport system substrate-binding protein|nr:zinc ABC transporter substrate-binding protein [Xanthobacteraceae bacterium]
MRRDLAVLLVAAIMALGAISAPHAQAAGSSGKLKVVASFSILRDLVAHVGGDRVEVSALVGRGADAHVYAPTPRDAKIVAAAGLIVVNGLGFEGWMARLLQASATQALVVAASAGVVPLPPPSSPLHVKEGQSKYLPPLAREGTVRSRFGNAAAGLDPHAWQSVHNAEIYVSNIRDGLIRADPEGRATYEANATAYIEELARLDADIRRAVATIPPARRKVITTHEAFEYFAADYGIAFIAAQGLSTETEPSARDIARIIRAIREENIPALFFESAVDPRLVKRIAAETGARIGGTLFADTLTAPAGPAPTYVDMMRHNVREIVEALK